MKKFLQIVPWLLLALFGAEVLVALLPRPDKEFHVREFGRLPVVLNGRVQPFDSVARNSLLQIRGTASVPLEEKKWWQFFKHPKKLKATEWLLEVMLRPEQADERPIFLIHHPDLLGELKLEGKGLARSGLHYFTFNEIKSVAAEISEQGRKAGEVEAQNRGAYQRQAMKVANAVSLYRRLKNSLRPEDTDDFAKELADFQKAVGPGVAALQAREAGQKFDQAALDQLLKAFSHFEAMMNLAYPLIVPPIHPELSRDNWANAGMSLMETVHNGELHPAMRFFAAMATAYRHHQPQLFNQAVDGYRQWLAPKLGKELNKGRAEFLYNDFQPFLRAMITYIFAFLLAVGALLTLTLWPGFSEMLRRSALYLVGLAFVVHTAGLIFRMVLEGRPPVTNLYSSAIFIGWGCVLLGVILERVFRAGIGLATGSLIGFVTLIIAHNLALGGDTMEMLRAVLDTNFWLATHVITITLGYAATFLAGFLAILYVILGVLTRRLAQPMTAGTAEALSMTAGLIGGVEAGLKAAKMTARTVGVETPAQVLPRMVYGIICFATLFSFLGTVLGGIWADQSWGRFWGWDPKENGALIIVLWNAAILHARWSGLVRERGLMNMAVFGNIVTSFSWFGVNMLGVGLHAYGFMDAAFKWLALFVASQLVIILLGCLPKQYWLSFRSASTAQTPSANLPQATPAPGKP